MLNPITYTERVVRDFLRYQLTAYPFADVRLHRQMRRLLNLEQTRHTPLLCGPYISLSQAFRQGPRVQDLAAEGVLHPHMPNIAPHDRVYWHQEQAIRAIAAGRTTLISTGTGSGKTESFLYPIISRCLTLRDEGVPAGIIAVIVYPMNALAEDQLERMRGLMAGSGVTFGLYIGKTPEHSGDVAGVRLAANASRADFEAERKRLEAAREGRAVHRAEERPSREELRQSPPRILLTNVKQLELLLTRQKDLEMFHGNRLEYMVFDEAHPFRGALGSETACLIRRLRAFCERKVEDTVCIAASATIARKEDAPGEGQRFASRFFGVSANNVEIVHEEVEPDQWAEQRTVSGSFAGDPGEQFENILEALRNIEREPPAVKDLERFSQVFAALTGRRVDVRHFEESLYERLAANELLYQASELLTHAQPLDDFCLALSARVGRTVPVEEILTWFALGAVARKNGRSLLRPVIHSFVRGVSGAVVTFPVSENGPRLWLSAEDKVRDGEPNLFPLPVMSCTTCGQQYFIHTLAGFEFTDRAPFGGEAIQTRLIWRPQSEANGGRRAVLIDRLVIREGDDDDDSDNPAVTPKHTAAVYFCRRCGTVHPKRIDRCDGCGTDTPLVELFVVQQRPDNLGKLTTCLACRSIGRRFAGVLREPARPVRAVNVSDVFVLGQSMIEHADHKRLLIFADNRQEAAFQAGWMQDHARRYRLRALMYRRILQSPVSVGDLAAWLNTELAASDDESRALAPEVWRVARREAAGNRHAVERFRFLRMQVLRELTLGHNQRIGLEPWGRVLVEYTGLQPDLPFFTNWAARIGSTAEELADGVANLLDVTRRARLLLDREARMFSRYWKEGEPEISNGYLPFSDQPPMGLKLSVGGNDNAKYLKRWLSARGQTAAIQAAKLWGVAAADIVPFFEELWDLLTKQLHILDTANLTGSGRKILPGTSGAMQIDADRILMHAHEGLWRCSICRRRSLRLNPNRACMVLRCTGTLEFEKEDPDNYDLHLLTEGTEMVKAREHSAQIPAEEREWLEREFKSNRQRVNALVATPTLELGVDIGPLDSVLMRNVPPLPANYWQRTGRAGRRQRMAVNVTYARSVSHDRAYFADPLKLLGGRIDPPAFNLRNDVMVRKHVHAATITALHLSAQNDVSRRAAILQAIETCLPVQITSYLFDATGEIRSWPFDLTPLTAAIAANREELAAHIEASFLESWPAEDSDAVRRDLLTSYIDEFTVQLGQVIDRLRKRLRWATGQMHRLEDERRRKGTLGREDEALYHRCDRLVKRMKGMEVRGRRESEGIDDTYTFGVLAAEGFLPGYGLDIGYVTGYFIAPPHSAELHDWQLNRSQALALREYVPGNLIYANGQRFLARYFHLEPQDPIQFQVDAQNGAICEAENATGGIGAQLLRAVPICDVDLPHYSHISDDEDYRFQMPVATYGYEQSFHSGGQSYLWGQKVVQVRRAVRLRIVNVGPSQLVHARGQLGYPVCTVCGQSRSPLASAADLNEFIANHQERCKRRVDQIGFYADLNADALSITGCRDRTEACSVAEALRLGATQILDMEVEDLQLLAMGRQGDPTTDVLLYDPMPGGSGLIYQVVARWSEVLAAAGQILQSCASLCQDSCVDCLQTFRNAYYHANLNRHVAVASMAQWGNNLHFSHDIPPRLPSFGPEEVGTNAAEETLRAMLERAGLHGYKTQYPIELGPPLGTTLPDFFYADPDEPEGGICIYLDGLSRSLHGNPETAARDRRIREQLRSEGFSVLEIPVGHLTDRRQMGHHFFVVGRILLGRDQARQLKDDPAWFEAPTQASAAIDEWDETMALLGSEWHPFAVAMRTVGVPAPREVDWDIVVKGRVSGVRAVMMWDGADGPFLLLQNGAVAAGSRSLSVDPSGDPQPAALQVKAALGEEA